MKVGCNNKRAMIDVLLTRKKIEHNGRSPTLWSEYLLTDCRRLVIIKWRLTLPLQTAVISFPAVPATFQSPHFYIS